MCIIIIIITNFTPKKQQKIAAPNSHFCLLTIDVGQC